LVDALPDSYRDRLRVQKRKKEIFDLILPFFILYLIGILIYPFMTML